MVSDAPPPGASRAWMWPVGLMVLLFGSVAIVIGTVVIAASDPSVSMEPDYYEQALAWDVTAAQREASARLGWRASAWVSGERRPLGDRVLRVVLLDDQDRPVPAERIEVVAFHHARSRERIALAMGTGQAAPAAGRGAVVEVQPGAWSWSLGTARAGMWQVRLRASRGTDVFVATLDVESAQEPSSEDAR